MKPGKGKIIFFVLNLFSLFIFTRDAGAVINIVAAENVYGEVAKELGGPYLKVSNILNSPNQDPHLFTTSPSTAIAINNADLIIYNGADYDPWMKALLALKGQKTKKILVVAELMKIKKGANPHIWYLPETIPTFAKSLVQDLTEIEPEHGAYFQGQLSHFNQAYQVIFEAVHQLRQDFQNTPVIATEPVFNYMAESLGFQMRGEDFQRSIMNDVPPTISQIKNFEDALRQHAVNLLIYNKQVVNPSTQRMLALAQEEGIPIVGVSEMLPNKLTYIQWIINELAELRLTLENRKELKHGSA